MKRTKTTKRTRPTFPEPMPKYLYILDSIAEAAEIILHALAAVAIVAAFVALLAIGFITMF